MGGVHTADLESGGGSPEAKAAKHGFWVFRVGCIQRSLRLATIESIAALKR